MSEKQLKPPAIGLSTSVTLVLLLAILLGLDVTITFGVLEAVWQSSASLVVSAVTFPLGCLMI